MGFTKGILTRAETATVFGMLVVIASLFLVWARVTPQDQGLMAATALYRSPQTEMYLNGFQTHVWLPITLCSVLCNVTLLWQANNKTRLPLTAVQSACALACLVIAMTHVTPLPGALVALGGGALLVFGAIDRYHGATPKEN
jgi:hypothetical protein